MRRNISAVVPEVVVDSHGWRGGIRITIDVVAAGTGVVGLRMGRNSDEQHCSDEGELSQGFHILIFLFEAVLQCRRRLPPVLDFTRIATIRHTDKVGWNDSRRWRYDNVLHRKYFADAA